MRTSNLPSGAMRVAETGHIWEEILSNDHGTIELDQRATFRVRAAAAVTVTINGKLAMTMVSGEIAIFNAGDVDPAVSTKRTVTVVIAGDSYVQVGREVEHKRQIPN